MCVYVRVFVHVLVGMRLCVGLVYRAFLSYVFISTFYPLTVLGLRGLASMRQRHTVQVSSLSLEVSVYVPVCVCV